MPNIILKKTFKVTSGSYGTRKQWTFHGTIGQNQIVFINQKLAQIRSFGSAGTLQFRLNGEGHYFAVMNDDYQKYNEEDGLVFILDAMEEMGYNFRFQYDAEFFSNKGFGGNSLTKQEIFIFHKRA